MQRGSSQSKFKYFKIIKINRSQKEIIEVQCRNEYMILRYALMKLYMLKLAMCTWIYLKTFAKKRILKNSLDNTKYIYLV